MAVFSGINSAANTDLLINRTETAVGSGTQLFTDYQVGGVSKYRVTNTGKINSQGIAVTYATGGKGGGIGESKVDGAANTGNGGAPAYTGSSANGGSGIVIISYITSDFETAVTTDYIGGGILKHHPR
jgi:hypothetical protein